jgi:hypothetical protein
MTVKGEFQSYTISIMYLWFTQSNALARCNFPIRDHFYQRQAALPRNNRYSYQETRTTVITKYKFSYNREKDSFLTPGNIASTGHLPLKEITNLKPYFYIN